MKLMIVSRDTRIREILTAWFEPRGYEIIAYKNPLKAVDNYDEVRPDAVLFNGVDFPRHWKIGLSTLRTDREKTDGIFILLSETSLTMEEADKAVYLGVNALFIRDIRSDADIEDLEKLINRYKKPRNRLNETVLKGDRDRKVEMAFLHPETMSLVSGRFVDLSLQGGGFRPYESRHLMGLKPKTILRDCSIKGSAGIMTIDARIDKVDGLVEISFLASGVDKIFTLPDPRPPII
jgi:hypothetical protein